MLVGLALFGCGVAEPPQKNATATARSTLANEMRPSTSEKPGLLTINRPGLEQFLSDHRGKVILIDFWATWCPPCVEGYPHLVALSRKYDPQHVTVAAIAIDEPEQRCAILELLDAQQASFPNFRSVYGSVDGRSLQEFGVFSGKLPTLKLFDRHGSLSQTFGDGRHEAINFEAIEVSIRALLRDSNTTAD